MPLVADIHFQPKVAMDVAEVFEKIRINPGNFVDGRKTFEEYVYDSKVGQYAVCLLVLVGKCALL